MFENRGLEILIIAVVVLVLFGSRRLPDAARSLGKSLRILKAETRALRTDTSAEAGPVPDAGGPADRPDPVAPTLPAAEAAERPATSQDAVTTPASPS